MFSYKFYVREDKNDALRLRVTNNRKKAEVSMGLKISQSELDLAMAGASKNTRLEKLLASWTAQIKELMLELSDTKESDMESNRIVAILKERLLGVAVKPTKPQVVVLGNFKPYYAAFVEKWKTQARMPPGARLI